MHAVSISRRSQQTEKHGLVPTGKWNKEISFSDKWKVRFGGMRFEGWHPELTMRNVNVKRMGKNEKGDVPAEDEEAVSDILRRLRS